MIDRRRSRAIAGGAAMPRSFAAASCYHWAATDEVKSVVDSFDSLTVIATAGGPTSSSTSPLASDPSGNRVGSRDSLFLMAQLRLGDEAGMREVRVRNLSERGLMLELDKVVAIATPVQLCLRGIGDVSGKVAWCTEGRIGVALDLPIDPKKARKSVGVAKPDTMPFQAKASSRS
ncbi:PilZ domain-containing protein [Sphingomonas sp. PB2P12]|uniref:PilZ domain-containing protein n=1 Tax=Sphingomonas sandaracina TaxID=3096157 RepID=UPI002FC60713